MSTAHTTFPQEKIKLAFFSHTLSLNRSLFGFPKGGSPLAVGDKWPSETKKEK